MQPEDLERTDMAPTVETRYGAVAPHLEPPTLIFPEPAEKRDPFWDYFDLLLVLGLGFAAWIVINLSAAGWLYFHPELGKDLTSLLMPLQYVAYILIYLCFYCVFKFKYDRPVFQSLGLVKTGHSLLIAGVGGVLLAFGLGIIANFIHTPKVDTPFDELGKTPLSMFLLAVTAVVAAPLIEEMVFRGFLQPLFSRTFGTALGILLTAVLFGGLHATEYQKAWQYVAAITIVGVALGILRAKTKSILPGTIMHGCFNAVSVVGLLVAKFSPHK